MKEIIGLITVVLSIAGPLPYIRDTYRKKTVPHLFTWIIAVIIIVIVFFGQLASGGGAGVWSTGSTGILIIIIVALALRNKATYSQIKPIDILFLIASLGAILPWLITKDPTLSIIFAAITDMCSMIPTLRKTIKFPESETLITYEINIVRHALTLFAFSKYNIATMLFPIYLMCVNLIMTLVILRGRAIKAANLTQH